MFCVYGDVYCAVIMAECHQEHFWRVSAIGHECVHRDVCVYVMHACACTDDCTYAQLTACKGEFSGPLNVGGSSSRT